MHWGKADIYAKHTGSRHLVICLRKRGVIVTIPRGALTNSVDSQLEWQRWANIGETDSDPASSIPWCPLEVVLPSPHKTMIGISS